MAVSAIKSLEKGIDLIMLFSERRSALSLPEIAAALALPESTVYRLITTLQKKHVIARDAVTKKYVLDVSLLRLQQSILDHLGIPRLALPHLQDLAFQSGETAHLYLLQGHQMVLAEAVNSPETIRFVPDIGTMMPLHAPAGGRAILAFLSDDFLARYLDQYGLQRMTPETVTEEHEFRRILADVRSSGFALSTNQLYVNAAAVAAPVSDHRDQVVGSLTIAGPTPRLSEGRARQLAPLVVKHAAELSVALGATGDGRIGSTPRANPIPSRGDP